MPLRSPLPHQVEAAVIAACKAYSIDKSVLISKSQTKDCTHTRQLFWLILFNKANGSYRGIARALPVRFSKTAVASGIETATGLMEVNEEYAELVINACRTYTQICKK